MFKSNQRIKTLFSLATAIAFSGLMMASPVSAQSQQKKAVSTTSDTGFAVVELFTSQGCSSCPSADETLAAITKQAEQDGKKVITLSFHVVNPAKEKHSLSLTIPEGVEANDLHVVAYLQSPMDADIHAVATSEIIPAK